MIISSLADFREAARRRLPRFLFDYVDGGAYAEWTLKANVAELSAVALRQRVLRDVSHIDLSTELFGKRRAMPFGFGPVGLAGMYARRGETQAARAAVDAGIPFCLSTVSVCALDEVADAAGAAPWFQLYIIRDRGFMRELLAKAKALGCEVLMFTVDMPAPGARYRDAHSGLAGPNASLRRMMQAVSRPSWALDVGVRGRPHTFGNLAGAVRGASSLSDVMGWISANFDASISWRDLEAIRNAWDGPLVIKGILDPADAVEAANLGADGIVVSNHGGRQLDGVLSTARALPPIADIVKGRLAILADGGVRSGLDVVRMLALGADGVLLGRAWAYALAAGGFAGVRQMVSIFEQEMRTAMMLTGVTTIAEIDARLLAEPARRRNPHPDDP